MLENQYSCIVDLKKISAPGCGNDRFFFKYLIINTIMNSHSDVIGRPHSKFFEHDEEMTIKETLWLAGPGLPLSGLERERPGLPGQGEGISPISHVVNQR